MTLSINRDELRMALDKLCKIASNSPADAGASELKFTVANNGVVIQSANVGLTMTARYVFSTGSCEVDGDAEFCIPAASLRDSVNLLKGDNIEFTQRQRTISIKGDGDDSADAEHSLTGMLPDGWHGASSFNDEDVSFLVDRGGLVSAARFTSFSCMSDPSQAPLTAIRTTMTAGGDLKAISSDLGRTSFLSFTGVCKEIVMKDGVDNYSFMLTPMAAKMIQQMFGQEYSDISIKTNGKRILFKAGGLSLDVSAEVGIDNYPRFEMLITDDAPGFSWSVDLSELKRVVNLVGIVASKHLARIEFTSAGKIIISGMGKQERGSKSRQTITPIETSGDLLEENHIDVACVDLIEALSIPSSDQIKIGLRETTNPDINPVLFIEEEDDDVSWKHMMNRSVSVD